MGSLFKPETIKAEKEFQQINAFAANVYNVEVIKVEVVQVEDTNWDNGKPVKIPDVFVDNVKVELHVESTVDGSPVVGADGTAPTFNWLNFWFDPTRTGISKKGPAKSRIMICTLMGWEEKAKINLAVLEDLIVNKKLIGQKCRAIVSLTEAGKNRIDNFMPAKK